MYHNSQIVKILEIKILNLLINIQNAYQVFVFTNNFDFF